MTNPRISFRIALLLLFSAPLVRTGGATDLQADYEAVCKRYEAELTALADEAEAAGRPDDAALGHDWRPVAEKPGMVLFVAADQYSGEAPAPLSGNSANDPWSKSFRELRAKQADALFKLAKRAAEEGQLSFAFQWATEAVRENLDHADARRVLGFVEHDGRWLTAYGAKMADRGQVWHPKYGWIRSEDLSRWEAGERPGGSKWVSAAIDAQRHAKLENGWQVRTDHFLIKTNHGLEAGAELAARLERLYQVWQQLFAGFHFTQAEVRRLFAGERQARGQSRPFRVLYYRSQDEYVTALRRRQPMIASTIGIYFDVSRDAHFFAGEGQDEGTLHHEAVHQLFQESRPAARHVGSSENFWIVEGIATYFESLRAHENQRAGLYYTIGEPSAGRLAAARERLLDDGFYVPLAEVTTWGKDDLQRHVEIKKVYSQAAGMTTFLMHGHRGRFREPLVRYLQAVYGGKDDAGTLAENTGESYGALDKQYAEFLKSLP